MHPECFFVVERILIRVLRKINRLQKSTLINASINTSWEYCAKCRHYILWALKFHDQSLANLCEKTALQKTDRDRLYSWTKRLLHKVPLK